jgi:uncharacterized protein with PQ loop repeat
MGEWTMQTWWLTALGLAAGLCTSLSFVPQVLKAWREGKTEAISKRMYMASLIAYGLWIVHGLMITSVPRYPVQRRQCGLRRHRPDAEASRPQGSGSALIHGCISLNPDWICRRLHRLVQLRASSREMLPDR